MADHFCGRHDRQTPAEYTANAPIMRAANKLDAEHFAAAPDDLASLTNKCMRYRRKSKPISDFDTVLSYELRTVQRNIQNLLQMRDAHRPLIHRRRL
jgi:hypothetical protein